MTTIWNTALDWQIASTSRADLQTLALVATVGVFTKKVSRPVGAQVASLRCRRWTSCDRRSSTVDQTSVNFSKLLNLTAGRGPLECMMRIVTCVAIYARQRIFIYSVCVCMRASVCVSVCVYECVSLRVCICLFLYVRVCMREFVYLFVCFLTGVRIKCDLDSNRTSYGKNVNPEYFALRFQACVDTEIKTVSRHFARGNQADRCINLLHCTQRSTP